MEFSCCNHCHHNSREVTGGKEFNDILDIQVEGYMLTFGQQLRREDVESPLQPKKDSKINFNCQTPNSYQTTVFGDKTPSSVKSPCLFSPTQRPNVFHAAARLFHSGGENQQKDGFNDLSLSTADSPIPIWNANTSGESPLVNCGQASNTSFYLSASTPVTLDDATSPLLHGISYLKTPIVSDSSEDEVYGKRYRPPSGLAKFMQNFKRGHATDASSYLHETPTVQNGNGQALLVENEKYYTWTDSLATPPPSSSSDVSWNKNSSLYGVESQEIGYYVEKEHESDNTNTSIAMDGFNCTSRINNQSKVVARILFETNANSPSNELKDDECSISRLTTQTVHDVSDSVHNIAEKEECSNNCLTGDQKLNFSMEKTQQTSDYELLKIAAVSTFAEIERKDISSEHNFVGKSPTTYKRKSIDDAPASVLANTDDLNLLHFSGNEKNEITDEALLEAYTHGVKNADQATYANDTIINSCDKFSPPSCGFQTAAGNNISISEESLHKAKSILHKIEEETNNNSNTGSITTTTGVFQTASGNKVSLSEESLHKAKALLNRIEESNDECLDTGFSISTTTNGFQTAAGNRVGISEESMRKARAIMCSVDEEVNNKYSNSENNRNTAPHGFQKTDRSRVSLPKERIHKSKALLNKINEDADNFASNTRMDKKTENEPWSIPEAASSRKRTNRALGSKVTVTPSNVRTPVPQEQDKSARLKTESENCSVTSLNDFNDQRKQPMRDMDPPQELTNVHNCNETTQRTALSIGSVSNNTDNVSNLSGFTTASGQVVSVSKKAMQRASALLDEIDNSSNVSVCKPQSNSKTEVSNESSFRSNKLDNAAVSTIKYDMHTLKNLESAASSDQSHSGLGFSTAAGNKVHVSDAALQRARALLIDTGNEPLSIASEKTITTSCNASIIDGKNRSNSNFVEAKSIVNAKFMNHRDHVLNVDSFQTANGTTIKVSDESLKIANSVLSDIDDDISAITKSYFTDDFNNEDELNSKLSLTADFDVVRESEECAKALLSDDNWRNNKFDDDIHYVLSSTDERKFKPKDNITECAKNLEDQSSRFDRHLKLQQSSGVRGRLLPRSTSPFAVTDRMIAKPVLKPLRCSPLCAISRRKPTKFRRHKFRGNFSWKMEGKEDNRTRKTVINPIPIRTIMNTNETESAERDILTHSSQWGNFLRMKSTSQTFRKNLKSIAFLQRSRHYTEDQLLAFGVKENTLNVSSKTAMAFNFINFSNCKDRTADCNPSKANEDSILFSRNNCLDVNDFIRVFLDLPEIASDLINERWISNHYKWIVWKLSSYEVCFPEQFAGRALTPENVMAQLHYRYDIEINHCKRSSLKKILEKDDVSSRTLVLCVSDITRVSEISSMKNEKMMEDVKRTVNPEDKDRQELPTKAIVELTDGWYSIKGLLDRPLTNLLYAGKIVVGQKLCIFGAEVIGQTEAVSPLEAPDSVMLRLSANSTRRARWYARLGYQRHARAFPIPIESLYSDGGIVGCIDVVVARSYPVTYMEKDETGCKVINERAEDRAARKRADRNEKEVESLYTEALMELEENVSMRGMKRKKIDMSKDSLSIKDGKQLFEMYLTAVDPVSFENQLNDKERQDLVDYKESLHRAEVDKAQIGIRKKIQDKFANLNGSAVTPLKKIRVVSYEYRRTKMLPCLITIWRPSEDVMEMLKEGSRLKIYHLSATSTNTRTYDATANIQLTTTRTSKFRRMSVNPDILQRVFPRRQIYQIGDIKLSLTKMSFDEFDCVGIVVYVDLAPDITDYRPIDSVYLADRECNLLCIRFFKGLKYHAVDDLLNIGSAVSICNLQSKQGMDFTIPIATATEFTKVSRNLSDCYSRLALDKLLENLTDTKYILTKSMDILKSLHVTGGNSRNLDKTYSACSTLAAKYERPVAKRRKSEKSPISIGHWHTPSRPQTRSQTKLHDK